MPPETKTDCETKKHVISLQEITHLLTVTSVYCIFDMVTISFVCHRHQKPHSLQPNQMYGNPATDIHKSYGVISC
jgi:energy-converting hydrogenase Eha subunit F